MGAIELEAQELLARDLPCLAEERERTQRAVVQRSLDPVAWRIAIAGRIALARSRAERRAIAAEDEPRGRILYLGQLREGQVLGPERVLAVARQHVAGIAIVVSPGKERVVDVEDLVAVRVHRIEHGDALHLPGCFTFGETARLVHAEPLLGRTQHAPDPGVAERIGAVARLERRAVNAPEDLLAERD